MKEYKNLIITILFIFILILVNYRYLQNFRKILSSGVELPKFDLSKNFDLLLSQKGEGYKDFVSPDGKLALKYPLDWALLPNEGLEKFNQEMIKEGAKILFFAQKFRLKETVFYSIIIQELSLKEGEDINKIFDEIKKEAEEKGGKIEIIESEIEDKQAYLKAEYVRNGSSVFNLKEKIIIENNKIYLIILFTSDKNWEEFENEVNPIIDSIQINQ